MSRPKEGSKSQSLVYKASSGTTTQQKYLFIHVYSCLQYLLQAYPGPDPEMVMPGGTGSRSFEPSGESCEGGGGEYERGLNPLSLGGRGDIIKGR